MKASGNVFRSPWGAKTVEMDTKNKTKDLFPLVVLFWGLVYVVLQVI